MRIGVFGAGGRIGQRIVKEALARGHEVTAIVRDPARFDLNEDKLQVRQGDAADTRSIVRVAGGHDAIVSALGPTGDGKPDVLILAAASLMTALPTAGIRRLVVVGGAGSLETAPGQQLLDAPDFPEGWKPVANAHKEALRIYRSWFTPISWTYISPAAVIEPGERTGKYRKGGDQLLTDDQGQSRISMEDFAVAVVDELESRAATMGRMSVAY
ncbi:MAG TPA: NAD(P)H-binding protein [Chloroflexota bacterium]|nr:NAD(P)H-binding protein [Chloroflexota bacterium]